MTVQLVQSTLIYKRAKVKKPPNFNTSCINLPSHLFCTPAPFPLNGYLMWL